MRYAEETHGKVIHETDRYVIRLRLDGDDATIVFHKKRYGAEYAPGGFVVGYNYISTKDFKDAPDQTNGRR